MTTWRVSKLSSEEMVNSPSTSATETSEAEIRAARMFGTTMRQITPAQEQPRLRPASASVTRSIADRPAAMVR